MEKGNRSYSNDEITVFWKPETCIHATICFRELREVFRPSKRPWVDMTGASTSEIIKIVDKCPTDALTWKWNKDIPDDHKQSIQPKDSEEDKTEIRVMKDGPIVVSGNFLVFDEKGKALNKMKMMSFCRCGSSNSLPFCDGSHRKIAFEAD